MKALINEVLSPFEESYRPLVIEYGKRLSEYSRVYDVLVFMARKSICFAEALRYADLVSFQSIVTSNRILDFNLDWIKGKRVAIIDDALITGTSIYKAKNKLNKYCSVVDVFVLCVNEDYWSKELINPEMPYAVLSDQQTAEICSDIVDSISLVPVPYATDYPLYSGFLIYSSDYEALFSNGDWIVSDVSSSLQQRNNVHTKTFEPTSEIYRKLYESLGIDLSSNCLVKVRFYERKKKGYHWCSILPIIAFEPLKKDDIDRLFFGIMSFGDIENDKYEKWFFSTSAEDFNCDDSYKAKLRIINYIVSSRLADIWFESIQKCMIKKVKYSLDVHGINYLFPFIMVDDVIRIINKKGVMFSVGVNNNVRFSNNDGHIPYAGDIDFGSKYEGTDGWSVEMCLMQPFISLYKYYELKARVIAKEQGIKIFEDPVIRKKYEKYVRRLEYGFSLKEIGGWLKHLDGSRLPVKKAISLFLDKMIDRGVVVPMTCVKDDYVFRGYRHGEDVNFGLEEKKIVGFMLTSFCQGLGKKYLSGVDIEKATVLLIRRGLDEGFLIKPEKFIMGAPNTIGIRFSLHGAVVEQNSKSLFDHQSGCSIRDIMTQAGYLTPIKVNSVLTKEDNESDVEQYQVTFDQNNREGIKERGLLQAKKNGLILGSLRANARKLNKKARLTKREITLLATISSTRDLLAALGAEISVASRGFNNSIERYLREYEADSDINKMVRFMRDAKNNHVFVSIHSGSWKYHEYINNTVWSLIDRIKRGFEEENKDLNAIEWDEMWSGKQRLLNMEDKILSDLIISAERWIFEMRLYYLLYEISFLFCHLNMRDDKNTQRLAKIQNELRLVQNDIIRFDKSLASLIDQLLGKIKIFQIDYKKLKYFAIKNMKTKSAEAIDLIKTIDFVAGNYGVINEFYKYAHCMLLKINAPHTRQGEMFSKIKDYISSQILIYSKKYNLIENSVRIVPSEFFGNNQSLILLVAYGNKEFDFLSGVMVNIIKKYFNSLDFRFIFLHDMPPNMRIYAPKTSTDFYGKMAYEALVELEKEYTDVDNKVYLACTGQKYTKKAYVSEDIETYFEKMEDNLEVFVQDISKSLFIEKYKFKSEEIMKNKKVDVGIITVVADEARAVNSVLVNYPGFVDEVPGMQTGYDYSIGYLPSRDSDMHSIACVQSLKQGNTAIMPLYQAMVEEYDPYLMVLIGISGRIDQEYSICDVCVPNYVLNYDFRAETPEGVKRTFDPLPPLEQWIVKIITRMQRKFSEELVFDACEDSYKEKFCVSLGPIGSGGAVVKDEDSEIKDWLKSTSRKTSSLETEAVGFAQQYQSNQLKKGLSTKGFMIIRGISDKADQDKDKKYRVQPAKNAMLFLEKFLSFTNKSFEGDI